MQSAALRYRKRFGQNIYKPDSSCVLYLEGQQDAYSSTIKDLSGYANNGTITGATWVRLPSGLWVNSFDGTDDIINCGTNSVLNFTTGDFSGIAWVKTTVTANVQWIMGRGLGNTDGWAMLIHTDGRVDFETYQAGASQLSYAANNTTVTNGQFNLIGWTRTGTSCRVWLNGVDITNTVGNHTNPLTSTRALKIGNSDTLNQYPFTGQMGLERIFSYYLSATEIANIYQRERPLFPY